METNASTGESSTPKPRFKTNNVNKMFKAIASSDNTADGGASGAGEPSTTSSVSSSTKITTTSNGLVTLSKKKDPVTSTSDSSSTTSAAPSKQEDVTPSKTSAEPASTEKSSVPAETPAPAEPAAAAEASSASSAKEPPKPTESSSTIESTNHKHTDYTPEELENKGIHVAGRFHSSSNENWEDEEADWTPPGGTAHAAIPTPVSSIPKHTSVDKTHSGSAAKPLGSSTTATKDQGASNDGPAWSSRPSAVPAKPLSVIIQEAKEKGASHGVSRGTSSLNGGPRSVLGARAGAASNGKDSLSRFRLNTPVIPAKGGPPPLNPRTMEHGGPPRFDFGRRGPPPHGSHFDMRGPPPSFYEPPSGGRFGGHSAAPDTLFLTAKPRLSLDEPEVPKPTNTTPRPLPDRLRSDVPRPAPVKPTPAPAPAAKAPEATNNEPAAIIEEQREEMRAALERVKARKEAEMKAEKERQAKLQEAREQLKREAERKQQEKEAEERAKHESSAPFDRRRAPIDQPWQHRGFEAGKKSRGKTGSFSSGTSSLRKRDAVKPTQAPSPTSTFKPVSKQYFPPGPKADTLKHSAKSENTPHADMDNIMGAPIQPENASKIYWPSYSHKGDSKRNHMLVKLPNSDNYRGSVDISSMLESETSTVPTSRHRGSNRRRNKSGRKKGSERAAGTV